MDIEDLKRNWQQLELRVNKAEFENRRLAERLCKNNATGIKHKLMARYRAMTIVCAISPLWIILFNMQMNVNAYLFAGYISFFVIMALATAYIWFWMANTDYMSMTVKDAIIATYKAEKLCKNHNWIGFVTGIPLLVFLMITISETGEYVIITGAWTGLIVGGLIGLYIRLRNRRLLREMRRMLEDELDDTDECSFNA